MPADSLQHAVYLPHMTAKHGGGGVADEPGAETKKAAKASNEKAGLAEATLPTLIAVVMAIVKTIFVPTTSQSLNRTGVFMIAFLVIHMVGNLTLFASDDAFNT